MCCPACTPLLPPPPTPFFLRVSGDHVCRRLLTRTGPCPCLRLSCTCCLCFAPFPNRTSWWSGYCRAFLPTDDRSRDYNPFSFSVWMPIHRKVMQLSLPLLTVTLFYTGAISLQATASWETDATRIAQQFKIDGTKTRQRTH
jgi:hypothetical protein